MTDGSFTLGNGGIVMGDASVSTDVYSSAPITATTTSTISLDGGTMDIAGNITLGLDANNTSTFTMNDGFLFANDILGGRGKFFIPVQWWRNHPFRQPHGSGERKLVPGGSGHLRQLRRGQHHGGHSGTCNHCVVADLPDGSGGTLPASASASHPLMEILQ